MMAETRDVRLLPPGLLAYIGDGVYELQARNWLVEQGYLSLNRIHRAAVGLVNASAQARGLRAIEGQLSGEEAAIVRRGRNFRTGSIPGNVDPGDYRQATGLEALFGYLYLTGNKQRLNQLWQLLTAVLVGEKE